MGYNKPYNTQPTRVFFIAKLTKTSLAGREIRSDVIGPAGVFKWNYNVLDVLLNRISLVISGVLTRFIIVYALTGPLLSYLKTS